ncbi:uncharacterized protein LOC133283878 [Gastrolobium bilobum]|uniref:uncharacterized protein LOC133283878 n=1 Tax=Gastrolobium bilobum TaxID=150636 RepID=UPI002AB0E434|nr:uncharacterized protein LOC133283878 [Gastrolobium bilobum]
MSDNRSCERKNMFDEDAWCVGSSNNWLMLFGRDGYPFLLHPSSDSFILLPQFPHSFLAFNITHSYFAEALRKTFVSKFVFMGSASPSHYFLAILYGHQCKLALFAADSWVELSDAQGCYRDIVFVNNYLYALAKDDSIYLVISKGEFLLVKKYIGNFVDADGVVVDEAYILSSLGVTPCPYRTKHFTVYALDFGKIKWEKKRILLDQALFVGTESKSVPAALSGCQANSIYFTGDRLEEMDLDWSYGGNCYGYEYHITTTYQNI